MRNRTLLMFMAIAVFGAISCEKPGIRPADDYLPLKEGNYWKLKHLEKREVIGTQTIGGKDYYLLLYRNDSSYYRTDKDKIWVIEYDDEAGIKFDLSADAGDTWWYNQAEVTLISKTDTISINDHKLTGCYQFYFDVPGMVDEEHSIWLAPGIGFVQESCGECLHYIKQLDTARINGQLITY